MSEQTDKNMPSLNYQPPDYNTAINDQPAVAIAGPIGFVPQQPAQQQTSVQYQPPPQNPYGQQPQPNYYGQQSNPYGQQPNPYGQQPNPYGHQQPNSQPVVIIHQGRGNKVGPPVLTSTQPLYRSQIIWGIVNAIIFFPLLFLWIPALFAANFSRKSYQANDFPEATREGIKAKKFNLICTISGVLLIIILATVLSNVININKYSSNAVYISSGTWYGCYSHPRYSYYVCYDDIWGEDCYYIRAYDFYKGKSGSFWKCVED